MSMAAGCKGTLGVSLRTCLGKELKSHPVDIHAVSINFLWGNTVFVFPGYGWGDVQRIRSTAEKAESRARSTELDLTRLNARVEALTLACQAMWELLRDRTDLTDEDIQQRMHEVDLRDGRADGRLRGVAQDCEQCGRPANARRGYCMYCGEPVAAEHIFDK